MVHSNIFIIKCFWAIVLIFIVISTTFRPICPPGLLQVFVELGNLYRTSNYVLYWIHGVTCSNSVCHNRVQVLSIPVLLLTCSQDWTCNLLTTVSLEAKGTNTYNRYAMCPAVVRQTLEEGRRTYGPKRCGRSRQ